MSRSHEVSPAFSAYMVHSERLSSCRFSARRLRPGRVRSAGSIVAHRSAPPQPLLPFRQSAAVARNLPPASLEILAKPRFLPGFQRFREVLVELLGQRTEVNSLL